MVEQLTKKEHSGQENFWQQNKVRKDKGVSTSFKKCYAHTWSC
jgi:hypothetical protein